MKKRSVGLSRLRVSADGAGVVSHAGVELLRELAVYTGLVEVWDDALIGTYSGVPVHAPGKVLTDLAVAIADGADSISDLKVLRDQPALFGPVASTPTAWRVLDRVSETHLPLLRAGRAKARAAAWNAGAGPDLSEGLILDIDATVLISHSEKQNAAPTWKKTFGFHPLLCFLDRPEISSGEALAGIVRPGNAGSNTAADHITVLDMAIENLPEHARPGGSCSPRVLIRADAAGATHTFAGHCRKKGIGFSFGFPITEQIRTAVRAVPKDAWVQAIEDEGLRENAWVVEITDLVDLSAWPTGSRLIVRKEHAHPGAQLTLFDVEEGYRHTAFITDTEKSQVPGQIAGLELRHRQHARIEDRIRQAKAAGLRNLPCRQAAENNAWLECVLAAADLVAWSKVICFTDQPTIARCEIDTYRYNILHTAARVTRQARTINLRLDSAWTWAKTLAEAFNRLRAAFT